MFQMRLIWLTFLALLLILPAPLGGIRSGDRGAQAAAERKFALVIGIGQGYQHPAFRTLQYAEQDAQQMVLALQKLGFQVAELSGEKATKQGIQQAFDTLAQRANHPDDVVVVYFSGHGAIQRARDREIPSLVPSDGDPQQRTSFITDTNIGEWLSFVRTRKILLILDSCYSAGIGGAEKRLVAPEQMTMQEVQARVNRIQQAEFVGALFRSTVILASSQARETSKETNEGGVTGGVFTYFLLQGLGDDTQGSCPACEEGTNMVTPGSWLEYARKGVAANADQEPNLRTPEDGGQVALLIPWIKPMPGATVRPQPSVVSTPAVRPRLTAVPTAPPQPRTGTIVVKLNVGGVDVQVNGSLVQTGVGPNVRLDDQPAGSYTIEVSKPGYLPRTLPLTLQEGERKQLVVNLSPRPAPTGHLTITTDPPGANVTIGGKTYTSPVARLSLRPGTYTVTIGKRRFQAQEERVTVEADKENRYSYQLMPLARPTAVPRPEPVVVHTPRPQPAARVPAKVPAAHFQFVRISAGTFLMGSPADEPDRESIETQHEVTISRPFEMQTTEVTQALWQAVMGTNPSYYKGSDLPVEMVSWNDVQRFLGKLNRVLGTNAYRLPTEAEWEFAARAGTTTPFWTGHSLTTGQANFGNPFGRTTPIRTFAPNPWGLYDMNGNVWEWVQDWYGAYPSGRVIDPTGPRMGSVRVGRGGSFSRFVGDSRSAARGGFDPGRRDFVNLGFRLARSVP